MKKQTFFTLQRKSERGGERERELERERERDRERERERERERKKKRERQVAQLLFNKCEKVRET